jgi:hypothetical protein
MANEKKNMSKVMEKPKGTGSGFGLYNYWHDLYSAITNKTLPAKSSISVPAKIRFNGKLTGLKMKTEDVKSLMVFALMHDPLKIGTEAYGDITNVIDSAKAFASWRRLYADEIIFYGKERRAIYMTAPRMEHQKVLSAIDQTLLEQLEAFDPSAFRR